MINTLLYFDVPNITNRIFTRKTIEKGLDKCMDKYKDGVRMNLVANNGFEGIVAWFKREHFIINDDCIKLQWDVYDILNISNGNLIKKLIIEDINDYAIVIAGCGSMIKPFKKYIIINEWEWNNLYLYVESYQVERRKKDLEIQQWWKKLELILEEKKMWEKDYAYR